MQTKRIFIALVIFIMAASSSSIAQQNDPRNYKAQNIDHTGLIKDSTGKVIGSIDPQGNVFDSNKQKLGSIDSSGTVKDAKGRVKGKAAKNGTFTNHQGEIELTVSDQGKECAILDPKGHKIGTVHQNYKMHACAIHCFFLKSKKTK
jgi:hypothetical protein